MPTDQALYEQATDAAKRAYAPYSGFIVGAALEASDGTVIRGCNVENASYGLAMCAERVAFCSAVAQGIRDFKSIAIHVNGADGQPCGACRQFMAELAPGLRVIYLRSERLTAVSIADLLPDPFLPQALSNAE